MEEEKDKSWSEFSHGHKCKCSSRNDSEHFNQNAFGRVLDMASDSASSPQLQETTLCPRCNLTFSAVHRPSTTALAQARANHVPSASENERISHRIANAQTDLARYDEEISKIRIIASKLKRERAALREYIHAQQSLQASVRRVPTEVITEIFLQCQPLFSLDPGRVIIPIETPRGLVSVRLGQVCHRWRRIALTLEKIWSEITVSMYYHRRIIPGVIDGEDVEERADRQLCIVKAYLERSGNHPLSLTIAALSNAARLSSYREILSAIALHSQRWKAAMLLMDRSYFHPYEPFGQLTGQLPLLEKLWISDMDDVGVFGTCPELNFLAINGIPRNYLLPWHQILDLTVHDVDLHAVIENTDHCRSLKSLTVVNTREATDTMNVSSNLQELRIQVLQSSQLSTIFLNITLPHLTSLSLVHTYSSIVESVPWSQKFFAAFLHRSSCPLQTLRLESILLSATALVDTLALMPTLTTLKIHEQPDDSSSPVEIITDAFLQSLTINHTVECIPLLPRLAHLEFQASHRFHDALFLDMLESRFPFPDLHPLSGGAVAILQSVALHLTRGGTFDPECRARLLRLSKAGLSVTLVQPQVEDT